MNKALLAIAVASVVLIAGCILPTGGTGTSTTGTGYPGVAFTDFYPVATQVQAGSQATIYFSVQNNGYYDAENVDVTFFNCGSINTGSLESTDADYSCNDVIHMETRLDKPDRELGIPGEVAEDQVMFEVPDTFPTGRSPSTFSARVSYDYKTSAARDVVFTTFDNWKEKGGQLEVGTLNFISDPAPLSLNLIAPDEPIIITDPEATTGQPEFTVSVDIKNLGSGFVADKTLKKIALCYNPAFVEPIGSDVVEEDDGTGTITITGGYEDFAVLDTTTNCLYLDNTVPDTFKSKLALIGLTNQWRTVDALFRIVPEAVIVQDIAGFSAILEYTYHTDTSTQITVLNT